MLIKKNLITPRSNHSAGNAEQLADKLKPAHNFGKVLPDLELSTFFHNCEQAPPQYIYHYKVEKPLNRKRCSCC